MHEELSGPGVLEWLDVRYQTILPAAANDGAISIVDSLAPVGSGPPRHVHEREDETFVILTGECEFWLEGQTILRRAGESVFVPRGREHTFRVVGAQPSSYHPYAGRLRELLRRNGARRLPHGTVNLARSRRSWCRHSHHASPSQPTKATPVTSR